ncbi:MAG TPA: glycosyltransferase family 4 protein [Patescibacteria group bacterium]|nr:glycosyltransferase family 4 protein [Patescibacteria group bacterium]
MKLLIVASYLPYPLHNGGHIRLYNLIKQLRDKHEITLICEMRPKQTQADLAMLAKLCQKVITVPRRKQWSLQNILRSGLLSEPFLITGHTLPLMREAIARELASANYDLIHVETFYVIQNVPKTDVPIVLVEHNIEYLIYQRYAQNAPFFLRPLLQIDVQKIKKAEEKSWQRATEVVAVSQADKAIINMKNCFVVANGVDMLQFQLKQLDPNFPSRLKTILFIGDYSYIQNRDAASFIIREVWPLLKAKGRFKLWIVGRNMPRSLKDLGGQDHEILFDDNNPKPTPQIFSEADILLAPIRVGGGTSYKIIESMAVGTPVVTTSLGYEGIEVTKNKDILVGDTPQELARLILHILSDKKDYQILSKASRVAVEKKYDWSVIASDLEAVYHKAVKGDT